MTKQNAIELDRFCDVSAWASDDATRLSITGVRIDVERKQVVATNGHILVAVPLPGPNNALTPSVEGSMPAESFTIPADALRAALKSIPKAKSTLECQRRAAVAQTGPSRLELTTWPQFPAATKQFVEIDRSAFPDYAQVVPQSEPTATVSVNPHYLKLLAEYAIAAKSPSVSLEVRGTQDLLVATCPIDNEPNRRAKMFIAPMRV